METPALSNEQVFRRKFTNGMMQTPTTLGMGDRLKVMLRSARLGNSSQLWENFKQLILFASLSQAGQIRIKREQHWTKNRETVARFISSHLFSMFMSIVVVLNLVTVLMEADSRVKCEDMQDKCSSLNTVVVLDHVFTVVFAIEMLLRLYVYQSRFLASTSNVVDSIVTITCVVGAFAASSLQHFSIIRLFRLLRVVRVLRLLAMFQELYLMVAGLASTMRTIFWACILLFVILSVLSVVALDILHPIQQQLVEEQRDLGTSEECARCARAFASLSECMFTLFSSLVLGDGVLDILIPLAERDVFAALFIFASLASIYLGISNLILSVIVDKSNEARDQDIFYQAVNNQNVRRQAKQELMELWQEIAHEGDNMISAAELKKLWASSTLFRDYFQSMDIDLGLLEYALTCLHPDGDGLVSFEQFARAVVRIKCTDPGPVSAFIKHALLDVLKEVSSVMAQCENSHHDVLKRISQCEAVTAAHVTAEAAGVSAAKGTLSTAITSPVAETATPTTSTATPMAREETSARTGLLEHRSFQSPTTKACHPAQPEGQLVPRHLNVDDVKPIIAMIDDIEERVHRIKSQVRPLFADTSAAGEPVRKDCLGHMSRLSAPLSEALPCYVPRRFPMEVPSVHPHDDRISPCYESCDSFSPSCEKAEHIGSYLWVEQAHRKGHLNLPVYGNI